MVSDAALDNRPVADPISFIKLPNINNPIRGAAEGTIIEINIVIIIGNKIFKVSIFLISIDEGNFSPDTVEGNINFNNVSLAYKNNPDKRVLNDISLTINKGETIAFVGKSGAGKTSLVNLLPRFYDNFEGTISVDGTSIKDYTLTNLRSQISIVSQDITLFNDSIENYISYGS